jgi:two-component SAPR family response regulator
MPQVNGFVLATIVRELHPKIDIIFMSDYDYDEVKNQYKDLIQYPQLTKPFKMKQLFKLLKLEKTRSRIH